MAKKKAKRRPRKPANSLRNIRVEIRVSAKQRAFLKKAAAPLPFSTWAREVLLREATEQGGPGDGPFSTWAREVLIREAMKQGVRKT